MASVTVEAYPQQIFRGEVEKIEPQAVVQSNVTMFPVIINLDNSSGLLKSGMNAEVEILVNEAHDIVLVPNNTIVSMDDARAAAAALGLNPESVDMGALRASLGDAAGGAPQSGAMPDMAALRAKVESGEITQDSVRTLMAAMRPGGNQRRVADPSAPRPSVLFVMNAQGVPEPRAVMIGLNDWDHTQVVSGVEAGDEIAVLGAAQLQAAQAQQLDRMRGRMGGGGPFPGGR